MDGAVNVVALAKDDERYVFIYDDESFAQAFQQLGRFAADPELSFTWYDAAALCQKIRDRQHDYVSTKTT